MRTTLRPVALAGLVLVVAACGGSAASGSPPGSVGPSGGPGASPSPTSGGAGGVEHATGATDVILRYDQGGGLVGPEFFASNAPIFTLYGDGTVIFRNPLADPLPPVAGALVHHPFRTARLSAEQIQTLLIGAIGEGGLGTARNEYRNDQVADAGTATFELHAGGIDKTVSVYALGLDIPGMQDGPARAAFGKLADRLADFDRGGSIQTDEYAPERYRGILLDGFPGDAPPRPWPWADLAPTDFVSAGAPDAFPLPEHVLTVAHVEALGVEPYRGGFQNLTILGPDGKTLYALQLRPMLPDDVR